MRWSAVFLLLFCISAANALTCRQCKDTCCEEPNAYVIPDTELTDCTNTLNQTQHDLTTCQENYAGCIDAFNATEATINDLNAQVILWRDRFYASQDFFSSLQNQYASQVQYNNQLLALLNVAEQTAQRRLVDSLQLTQSKNSDDTAWNALIVEYHTLQTDYDACETADTYDDYNITQLQSVISGQLDTISSLNQTISSLNNTIVSLNNTILVYINESACNAQAQSALTQWVNLDTCLSQLPTYSTYGVAGPTACYDLLAAAELSGCFSDQWKSIFHHANPRYTVLNQMFTPGYRAGWDMFYCSQPESTGIWCNEFYGRQPLIAQYAALAALPDNSYTHPVDSHTFLKLNYLCVNSQSTFASDRLDFCHFYSNSTSEIAFDAGGSMDIAAIWWPYNQVSGNVDTNIIHQLTELHILSFTSNSSTVPRNWASAIEYFTSLEAVQIVDTTFSLNSSLTPFAPLLGNFGYGLKVLYLYNVVGITGDLFSYLHTNAPTLTTLTIINTQLTSSYTGNMTGDGNHQLTTIYLDNVQTALPYIYWQGATLIPESTSGQNYLKYTIRNLNVYNQYATIGLCATSASKDLYVDVQNVTIVGGINLGGLIQCPYVNHFVMINVQPDVGNVITPLQASWNGAQVHFVMENVVVAGGPWIIPDIVDFSYISIQNSGNYVGTLPTQYCGSTSVFLDPARFCVFSPYVGCAPPPGITFSLSC
jgi:hypothetical protein